jgi:acyl-coenzyme A thioesterase PaaI-like protein
MDDSLFVEAQGTYVPTRHSTGPWSPDALHGGPVAALLAHALEAMPTHQPMFPSRLTVELLRSVVLEPMRIATRVVRPGRKVQVLEATLHRVTDDDPFPADATLVARATLQQIRRAPVELPDGVRDLNPVDALPPPPTSVAVAGGGIEADAGPGFHSSSVEHRSPAPFMGVPGPAVDWIRIKRDLLPGVPLSPLQRVAGAADFGNGISGLLPFGDYLFVNPDLSVFLNRLPVGEWVCLDATTRLGEEGTALAECTLFDEQGRLGYSVQTLIIERLG